MSFQYTGPSSNASFYDTGAPYVDDEAAWYGAPGAISTDNFLLKTGSFFGSFIKGLGYGKKDAEVIGDTPLPEKPNYTPLYIGGGAVLVGALLLSKKRRKRKGRRR